jgi:indolepyruvate ferredoxin oxidoreductase alpha subunit
MKKYVMGNTAIASGAVEAGVKVVTGYPGTPATEIVEELSEINGINAEWHANELVALEVALGASLCNVRSLAVMKHNGTNVATDFLMHMNFTGVRGGMVLVSADDPGGNSSQNDEDTRILVHTYAHLPIFDPSSPKEAKDMIKAGFELSEQTGSCFVLRPVMRVCHARSIMEITENMSLPDKPAEFINDRSRYVMSAVAEKAAGGKMRPLWRHELLNQKQAEFVAIAESSPFNWIEEGDGKIGLIGCGIGYSYIKEAESMLGKKLPVLKLGTLPLPRNKVLQFLNNVSTVIIFEELEPVVERLIKQLCFEEGISIKVLGRESFLPAVGELSAIGVVEAVAKLDNSVDAGKNPPLAAAIVAPVRTRTQCVGCSYRGLLNALKQVMRKHKGVVTGDIGCHDAGSFPPIELQSTIYCMGASIPIASGMKASGLDRPVVALIGDSTFFHLGINGLINAIYNRSNITIVVADNGTTAMTGFQPHAGSGEDIHRKAAPKISVQKLAEALGINARTVNPYNIEETRAAIEEAVNEEGVSVVVSQAPCYLRTVRRNVLPFNPRKVKIDLELCNGCKTCINDFGCPALRYENKKVIMNETTCVNCGLCADVCKRGAIS